MVSSFHVSISVYVYLYVFVFKYRFIARELHTVLKSPGYVPADNHGHFEGGVKLGVGAFNLVSALCHVFSCALDLKGILLFPLKSNHDRI